MGLESLPPDQRAVLQLVLGQGQGYGEIAGLLGIEESAVRLRAHAGARTLGTGAGSEPADPGLVIDFLLGQASVSTRESARAALDADEAGRSWARAVARQLAPLARDPLPDIREPAPPIPDAPAADEPAVRRRRREPSAPARESAPATFVEPEVPPAPRSRPQRTAQRSAAQPHSSRRAGAALIGVVALLVAGVIALLVTQLGGDDGEDRRKGDTSQTTTSQPRVETQINLDAPRGRAKGIAQVLVQGDTRALALVGQDLRPNRRDAYAVWLSSGGTRVQFLGFVRDAVAQDGRLSAFTPLPEDASKYSRLLVTRETVQNPRRPGTTVLSGAIRLRR